MPYKWTYSTHGVHVYFQADGQGIYVATAVNGLVGQAICNQLEASDPHGALLHRQGDCSVWRNGKHPTHEGACEFISQPINTLD
jgi:hypothetical protein